jgi:hypothetical protein
VLACTDISTQAEGAQTGGHACSTAIIHARVVIVDQGQVLVAYCSMHPFHMTPPTPPTAPESSQPDAPSSPTYLDCEQQRRAIRGGDAVGVLQGLQGALLI